MKSFNPLQVRYKHKNCYYLHKFVYQFQSLIGTLQTEKVKQDFPKRKTGFNPLQVRYKLLFLAREYSSQFRFNPLQVRYKPEIKKQGGIRKNGFQSLIGTLQTMGSINFPTLQSKVSIPYRYATNSIKNKQMRMRKQVSIPYRYATNMANFVLGQVCPLVSIPYRYATNHSIPPSIFCFCQVSIPYRYATNFSCFPFSQKEKRVSIPYRYATNHNV